jgi:hypothetical protein
MAGNDDGDRVGAIRESHGARRCWSADLDRKGAIADCLSEGNTAQRGPDYVLEVCAVSCNWLGREGGNVTLEIRLKRAPSRRRTRHLAQPDTVRAVVTAQQLLHARLMIFPLYCPEAELIVRDNEHRAGGCFDAFDREGSHGHCHRSDTEGR